MDKSQINFMCSMFQSFTTLVNNALRVAAINSVGDFVLFLGKIGVMALTAAVGLIWFKVSQRDTNISSIEHYTGYIQ